MELDAQHRPKLDLRERLLSTGTELLTDEELLAIVLGTGTEQHSALGVAQALLIKFDGIRALATVGAGTLATMHGVGPVKAARLLGGIELGRRVTLANLAGTSRFKITTSDAVVLWARPRLLPLECEEVWVLSLDGQNTLLQARRVARGGLHGCALTPKDILRPALRDGASAIILVHNHPSGDPTPSREDLHMTQLLLEACATVGVPLLDHIIVARMGHTSLCEFEELRPSD